MNRILALIQAAHGQCRFTYVSTTQVKLAPYNGCNLNINGNVEQIPAAGVTLSNSGLSSNTVYYIYAYMNSGTMTLEASATGHTTANEGIEVKTGDASRTLVGMVWTNGSSQFEDSASRIGVLSFFNRRRRHAIAWFTAIRSTSNTTATELHSEIRVPFIIWAGEYVRCRANGGAYVLAAGPGYLYVGVDTNSQSDSGGGLNVVGSQLPFSGEYELSGLTENASHFATIYGIAASGGSVNMTGNATQAAGQRTNLSVTMMG